MKLEGQRVVVFGGGSGVGLATVNRIPAVGEVFDVGPHEFTVLEADERRILKVRITPPDRPHPKTAAKED